MGIREGRSVLGTMTVGRPLPTIGGMATTGPRQDACTRAGTRTTDVVLSGVLAVTLAMLTVTVPGGPRSAAGVTAALVCVAAQAGTLLWIRRRPEPAMCVAVVAGVGLEILNPHVGWLGQIAAPLAYLAWLRPRPAAWVAGALVAASPAKLVAGGEWRDVLLAAAAPALGWTIGELGRTRALRRAEFRRRVEAEERTRIARELHDVVAHTMSVIVVQAGAAGDVFDARPDRARAALGAIQVVAAGALTELRTLLHSMRPDDEARSTAPPPGLARLEALVESMRGAGLTVELRGGPTETALPAAVDLSAYRIVQESLTNTLRHSRADRAEVAVSYSNGAVHLEIRDGGPARAGSGYRGGHGIAGMRERARMFGGNLAAGTLPDGGFRVYARLPVVSRP